MFPEKHSFRACKHFGNPAGQLVGVIKDLNRLLEYCRNHDKHFGCAFLCQDGFYGMRRNEMLGSDSYIISVV